MVMFLALMSMQPPRNNVLPLIYHDQQLVTLVNVVRRIRTVERGRSMINCSLSFFLKCYNLCLY